MNSQVMIESSSLSSLEWVCSMTVTPPFAIHSIVYDWLISHNLQFFSFCNRNSNSVDETNLETSSSSEPNHLIILLCLVLCLCLVSVLDKIKSFLKSIPNREIDNDNQTITTTQSNNTFFQKIVNYSMVLIHERRIGLIITTIGLFVFAFFVLSHKTDEQLILLIKSNKQLLMNETLSQSVSGNTTASSPSSIPQNTSNNLLETHSNQANLQQNTLTLGENSVNTNVQNTSPNTISKNQQLYISLIKSTWIDMQIQNQLKVETVTMTASQPETFLETSFKAILNIALLALKFCYIYLAMIGLILLLRWLTLGSLSSHPIGMTPPLLPTIPNASLNMNFASP